MSYEFFEELQASKHRLDGETRREAANRIAGGLTSETSHYDKLRHIFKLMRFIPAGRVQSSIGSTKAVTSFNCAVSSVIEDSMVDGKNCIMDIVKEAATIMRMGCGNGYDFSTLRPKGALIKKLNSNSSGPVPFMHIFNALGLCVASSGHRRGAQMGVLRIDHPDIEEFIHCKQNTDQLTGFNLSIGMTDEFMECLEKGKPFNLKWGGQVYKTIDPATLWNQIMRSAWDWAEPGILFLDTINNNNALSYCETIAATNPCGEQPLPPNGVCLLGSFNLPKYLSKTPTGYFFDNELLIEDIPSIVRAMDMVIDKSKYPLHEMEQEAKAKRRIGIGVTGVANTIEAMGFSYGSPLFIEVMEDILNTILDHSYRASAMVAKEKGAFPKFDLGHYKKSRVWKKLSSKTRKAIETHGLRNSHLTSIAPTGTISLTAGNVSGGIEPVFDYETIRPIRTPTGDKVVTIQDYAFRELGVRGKTHDQVTAQEHMDVLIAASKYVDSAVSKTVNCGDEVSWEDFEQLYFKAWKGGCKGVSVFRPSCKRAGLLQKGEGGETCTVDPVTGVKECN